MNWFLENIETPRCPDCGNALKPDIVLYEEILPADKWEQARDQVYQCDLLLVLGSSLTVVPVAELPYTALRAGAKVIIIDRSSTQFDNLATLAIQGNLADLLPIIKDKVLNEKI